MCVCRRSVPLLELVGGVHSRRLELLNKVSTNCNAEEEGFEVHDGYTEQGDSGSPHYVEYDNFEITLMTGIHIRNKPRGVAAYAINTKHDVEFGKLSTC